MLFLSPGTRSLRSAIFKLRPLIYGRVSIYRAEYPAYAYFGILRHDPEIKELVILIDILVQAM